jgi:hypothetical protein
MLWLGRAPVIAPFVKYVDSEGVMDPLLSLMAEIRHGAEILKLRVAGFWLSYWNRKIAVLDLENDRRK